MKVKLVKKNPFKIPEYETKGSAGVDLQANVDEPLILKPTKNGSYYRAVQRFCFLCTCGPAPNLC